MEITTREHKRVTILRVTGRVDAGTAPDFDAQLKQQGDAGRPVVVEMDETAYLSSAGVRALLSAQKFRGARLHDVLSLRDGIKIT